MKIDQMGNCSQKKIPQIKCETYFLCAIYLATKKEREMEMKMNSGI